VFGGVAGLSSIGFSLSNILFSLVPVKLVWNEKYWWLLCPCFACFYIL